MLSKTACLFLLASLGQIAQAVPEKATDNLLPFQVVLSAMKQNLPAEYDEGFLRAFQEFKTKYNRVYENEEEEKKRFENFKNNVLKISAMNKYSKQEGYSVTFDVNHFADRTTDELPLASGFRYIPGAAPTDPEEMFSIDSTTDLPPDVDWVEAGCDKPVEQQGQCGSCYAFSALSALEGAYCARSGGKAKLPTLSVQELVDCSQDFGNFGCNGGLMHSAYDYISQYGGVCSEKEYPYTGYQGTCRSRGCKKFAVEMKKNTTVVNRLEGVPDTRSSDEVLMALMGAVAMQPVTVAVKAEEMMSYSGGVFNRNLCGHEVNHAVIAVGYGTTDSGEDYWLIRNSWGPEWGENGYMRLSRHVSTQVPFGVCGILSYAVFPEVEEPTGGWESVDVTEPTEVRPQPDYHDDDYPNDGRSWIHDIIEDLIDDIFFTSQPTDDVFLS